MNVRRIAAAVLSQSGNNPAPYAVNKPLEVKTLELADPKPGEVLVRIDAAGLCHSDLSVINGDRPRPMPMALGHEAAATVLALGDAGDGSLAVGDRVVLVFLPSCGHCVACASGQGYLCANAAAANAGARAIAEAAGDRLLFPVEANEVFVKLTAAEAAALRAKGFEFYDWGEMTADGGEARFVTAWDQDASVVAPLAAAIAAL